MSPYLKIAVLGSTRGTNLKPLFDEIHKRKINARIDLVISNKPTSGILARAKELNIHSVYLPQDQLSPEAYDRRLSDYLKIAGIDRVLLLGYMRIISPEITRIWHKKMINVHPSLLPDFAGKMDCAVHQAVLDSGASETGCTVHEVDETVDGGAIIFQKKCPVHSDDTVDVLKRRVQQLEVQALADVIQTYC